MELNTLLLTDEMLLNLSGQTTDDIIDAMIERLVARKRIKDKAVFKAAILAREAVGSTGLEGGVAIPHAVSEVVEVPTIMIARSVRPIDYGAFDHQSVDLFFMLALPEDAAAEHLELLGRLAKYLLQEGFVAKLRASANETEVKQLFSETRLLSDASTEAAQRRPFVVAVSACATGIAHTYIAEESLTQAAEELGIELKVETNGASGVGNRLSAEDIKRAQGVIVVADKAVPMQRFAGKRLVMRPVKDGVHKPADLLRLAVNAQTSTYEGDVTLKKRTADVQLRLVGQMYKHLMSGVSAMLPFVISGGLLIALAFLLDQLLGVPQDQLENLGSYHGLAATMKSIGDAAFGFMLPVLAGYIAHSMADRPGLVAGFVAGMFASNGFAFGTTFFAGSAMQAGVPSGFLGALIGGFVAGTICLQLQHLFARLPKALGGMQAIVLYPLVSVLLTGLVMFVLNIPMSGVNAGLHQFLTSLSGTNAIVLGALVGGMMAVDMGGPINKAAYVFGTGTLVSTLETGGSEVMAAVMAAGMVPPLAITVATILFQHKFTSEERRTRIGTAIMGMSFITEGAIPFASSDPLRAIPSFVVSSALSGALVAASGIKLMAPHGGVFVIALTNNPVLYIGYIMIGALVGGVSFGFLRQKQTQNEIKNVRNT